MDEEEDAESTISIVDGIRTVISKQRVLVKVFRKSLLKNDACRRTLHNINMHEKQLTLDVKTRWNSMVRMVDSYLKIRPRVSKVLIDIHEQHLVFIIDEVTILQSVLDNLKPIELVVHKLNEARSSLL